MLNRLRDIFRSKTNATDSFLQELGTSDLFVISATRSHGIDARALTQEQLLAEIRRELEHDKKNQEAGYSLFVYTTASGQRRLPFFSSAKHAEIFCGEYSKERNRVFPLMVLQTRGTFLAKVSVSNGETVVLNDKSPDERVLTVDELAAARRMWG
jgi:hypothetical protein